MTEGKRSGLFWVLASPQPESIRTARSSLNSPDEVAQADPESPGQPDQTIERHINQAPFDFTEVLIGQVGFLGQFLLGPSGPLAAAADVLA